MTNDSKKIISLFTPNRLLILQALFTCNDTLCGCELIDKIDIPKNLLSYHIAYLKRIGIIEDRKCGRNKNYAILKSQREFVEHILKITKLI